VLSGKIGAWTRGFAAALAGVVGTGGACVAASCPEAGASLQVTLQQAADATAPVTAVVFGTLATPSCDDGTGLAAAYTQVLTCPPGVAVECAAALRGLRPGMWTHRLLVTDGEPRGQFQGRTQLLLDRSAGSQALAWPLYRSVHTVVSLDDAPNCPGCLRDAITAAESSAKPALIQFAPGLSGSVRLTAALPSLSTGEVTIDGFDTDGTAQTRTIDGDGLNAAALHIVGAGYQVLGLRAVNVGGDSDAIVVEGAQAVDDLLDSIEVVGRSAQVCGADASGCVIDGVCRTPQVTGRGFCGDDGISVRLLAGSAGPIRIRRSVVTGAHDKGIKVSDGGVAIVEDSTIIGNADGGLQATLGGQLTAARNAVLANRGTTSANGLAANGAATGSTTPGSLQTRGNLSVGNILRGISVRGLSVATLRDDFVCGNESGVAVLDAGGSSAVAAITGLAIVHNSGSGVVIADGSSASLGSGGAAGNDAFAFNGSPSPPTPANFRNQTAFPISAVGDIWEHCGAGTACDLTAVQALDIFTASLQAPVAIAPAQPTRRRAAPRITDVEPPYAAAGDPVRLYGTGFDAIGGAGSGCDVVPAANTCRPLRGNCVLIGGVAAQVIAVTPTMLVVRAPFTCVAPVPVSVRARWAHGFGRAQFCALPVER
jgi:hypothetical protein